MTPGQGRKQSRRVLARALVVVASLFAICAAGVVLASAADAVPANPAVRTLEQPDGGRFRARLWGDEYANGYETKSGYTVVRDDDGTWVYADRTESGDLRATNSRPDEDPPPAGVTKRERPDAERPPGAPGTDFESGGGPSFGPIGGPHTGTESLLVLFTQFANQTAVSTDAAYWNNQFFGASGSVKAYYSQASFGALTIAPAAESQGTANDGVVTVTLGYNHPNPGGGGDPQTIARDAIVAANASVNFASFDTNGNGVLSPRELHVIVVLAGYESSYGSGCGPSVWGHNWTIFSPPTVDSTIVGGSEGSYSMFGEQHCSTFEFPGHPATMGIMAHELGHDLGFPDLYDTNGGSAGIGAWSIMAGGSWLSDTAFAGAKPSMLEAFSKYYQGWITPTPVVGVQSDVTLPAAATNPAAIRLRDNPAGVDWSFNATSGTGEYFLIENRQQSGLDAALPGCGLLVWHIDETRSAFNDANANESRKLVDLEEADGLAELDNETSGGDAGDPYPGSSNKLDFSNTTNPNSNLYSGIGSGAAMHVDSTSCGQTMQADFTGPTGPLRGLSINDVSVPEGGQASFTLSATNPGAQVTVNVATSNGSASAPGDYAALATQTVTIPASATSVPVTVQTVQDSTSEPNETFFVNLSGPSAGAALSDASGTATIIDDDVRSITVNDITVDEGGLATFTVSATNPGVQITVSAKSSNGTATAGSDYTAIENPGTPPDPHGGGGTPATPILVTIPAGSSSVSVSTQTTQDTAQEPSETFFLNLTNASSGAAIGDTQGQATITDDDTPARSITVDDVSVNEGGQASFTISATNPGTQVTVQAATSNGSASAPGDYAALPTQTVTIPANTTTVPVSVQTAQDAIQESNETFFLNLSNASAGATIADASGTATIIDDDAPVGPRAISVNDITVTEGGTATFTISATNPGTEVTVKARTSNGTATAGADYAAIEIPGMPGPRPGDPSTPATPITVTIPASSSSVTVSTPTTQDAAQEPSETFFLDLTSPSSGATISDNRGQATINDDDTPGRSITVNDVSVNEGDVATFTLSATNPGTQVTVQAATSNGSATAPGDYTALSTTVTIPANATTATVTVATTEDATQEPSETFLLNLSNASAGATIADPSGTATIVDDDAPAIRSITVNDVAITEGGAITFTVSATNPGTQVSVQAATSNGSATAPGDYTALATTTVTIPANATSVAVIVPTVQDSIVEPSETFFLNLSNASAGAAISDGQGQATILNDDVAGPR